MNLIFTKSILVVLAICTVQSLNAQVTASFTTSQTTVCEGAGVGFTNTSTAGNGSITSCNWNFDNGIQSTTCGNTGIIYTSPGSYNVCLTVIGSMSDTSVACTTITVLPAPPIEFVATPVSGCTPFTITLQDTANTTQANWSWTWIISSDSTFCDAAVLDTIKRFDVNPFNYTVQNAGTYDVRLIIKNAVNCSADFTKSDYIVASPPPVADFTEDVQVDCDSFTNVVFTNTSQNCKNPVTYLWDFGDGSATDTATNPTHEYFGFGDFDVTLIITNTTSGCGDTIVKTINIPANDTASFTMDKTDGCLNENIQFTDLSSGNALSWLWNFGDGNTSTAKNPAHSYDSVGCFVVTLTVTIDSCIRTFTYPTCITIHPDPVISYQTIGDDFNCSTPYSVSFTSNLPAGVSPSWNFGDGNISTNTNPTNNYSNNGTFPVSLTGTDQFGCSATIVSDTIVIEALNVLFTADTLGGCVPIPIQFTDTSFSQSPITSWQWRFVDDQTGQTFTSNDTMPSINFNASGVYDAILVVTNSLGCVDSLVKTDYITIGALPNLSFFATDSVLCYNQSLSFLNYSDSSATNWKWFFGDGNFVQNQFSPNYNYSQLGTFSVTAIAEINGCADTLIKTNYIEVQPPIANFSGAATCQNPLDVQFNNFSIGAASYEWDFGDGSAVSTATAPVHSYSTTGIYNVKLRAFHANGCVDSTTRSINLNHPVAAFTWAATQLSDGCYRGASPIVMINNSQNAQNCRWEIPQATYINNTSANSCVPLIQFDTAGIFDITLIVFGQNGCNDTLTQQICISDIIPSGGIISSGNGGFGGWGYGYGGFCYTDTAGIYRCGWGFGGFGGFGGNIISNGGVVDTIEGSVFTNNSEFVYISGCSPLTVTFNDSSTVFPDTTTLTYLWNFGDGSTSTLKSPTHTYLTPTNGSVYMVSVRVTTSTGIVRTDTLNTFVRPTTPYTSFFASKDSVCIDENIDFINKTSGIELTYHWDFNNGDTAISRDTTYAFDSAGVYNVCLTVTDFNGCDSTYCKTIWVLEPTADFVADITSSNCDTLTVNFTNNSMNADSMLWNFGVLGADTTYNPTVVFGDPGNYTVCLTAVNTIGCAQTKCDTNLISVNGPVLNAYSFSPQATCIPAAIEFVAAGDSINTYKWIPQAGDTITKTTGLNTDTTIYTYNAVDTFYPQLIVENALGCQRHVFLDSIITTNPQAIFTLDTLAGCAPLTVVANADSSTFAVSYQWQATGGTIFNGSSSTPSIRFNNAGQYDSIRLVITDFTGCQDTFYLSDTVTVSEAFAGFAMDTTTDCIPLTVNFTDTSSIFADSIVSYAWDFGDAFSTMDTSSLQHPTYTYNNIPNNHGTNTVRLTITTQNGCSDVITQTVQPTFPNVSFTLDTFVCTGQTVNFNNQSSGVNITYAWNFGDGNTSTLQNPTHSYATEGVFTVCLTVTDVNGCDSTYCDSLRVADPVADFIAPTPFIACPPDTVCFTDQSLNAVAWCWDFGDGSLPSFEQNPCHVFTDPGEYSITLKVTSISGCEDTIIRFNYINVSGPYAEFTYTPLDSCTDMTVQICSDTLNNVDLIFYTTGDGFLDFYNNVSASDTFCFDYIYKNRGTYQPTIQIQDGSGCPRNIAGPTIEVSDPEPIFTLSQNSLCNPLTVTTSNSSIDASSYEWIATGGTISPNAAATNPTISYNAAGTYTVSLVVTDRNGCKDTASQNVVVADVMPSATASTNLGCRALTVQFTDNSTSYPDTITTWAWNFGDGNTDTIPNPTHIYTQNGTFTVTLTITNTQGCSRTITVDQITVTFPTIGFSPSRTFVCTGQAINFNNQSFGANITSSWDFGDGNTSTTFSPTYAYSTEGTFQVCLTVEDENNCDTTICQFILVADPKAEFMADTTYSDCYDSTFQFTDLSQNAISWEWDFGDGTPTVTQQNPSHTYTQTGTYTVCLIIASASGCRDTICKNQYIKVDGPTGNFAFTPKNGCAPTDVLLTGSGNNIKFYEWRVKENNTIITQENTSGNDTLNYTYTTAGTFFPDLNLIDSTGCSLLLTSDSIIVDTLQFDFAVTAVEICADSTLQFSHTINSSSPIDSIRWNFVSANTTTSTIDNPVITYSTDGVYDVELTVYSRHCTKTVTKTNFITIRSNPDASFSFNPQNGCHPIYASFTDLTTIANDSVTWNWTFGDGNNSTAQSPFHYYQNCDDFDILLTSTSSFGCVDTAQQTITIRCSPTSLFTADTFACTGQNITFNNLSTGNVTYNWNFGDGNSSSDQTPTHSYANEGIFQVCLTVTDLNGCDSTTCLNILIANPVAEFTADTTFRPCPPDSVQFTDLSSYAVGWAWNFGDGETSDLQHPMHTFDTSGFYTICLTVTSASGCQNTICKNQYIEIGGAKGDFSFLPKSGCAPLTVRFEANGYNAHRYIWDFGDGNAQTHTTNQPIDTFDYTYTISGEFYPTLRIEDTLGCGINITSDSVLVDTLQIDFYASDTLYCDNGTPTFTPHFYTNVPVDSFRWNFVGADISTSTALNPTPNYSTVGEWDVTLTVYTRFCTKTLTKANYIKIVDSPISNFSFSPTPSCDPETVQFTDLSSVNNDSLVSWLWNFDDNNETSAFQNPTHLYFNEGLYNVSLTVTSNYGCATTTVLIVEIDSTPISYFTADTFACTNQTVNFINFSTGNGLTYNWNFGDGNFSNLQTPTHAYINEGNYQICLTITDLNGCDSTYCDSVLIANPLAEFTADTTFRPCPPDSVQFTDLSANAVAWLWDFGDGQTSTLQHPNHTFDTSGFYTICLIVTSASGCQDTICKNQFIEIGGAKGNFTALPTLGCTPHPVFYEANGYNAHRYIWTFGDGVTQTHTTNQPLDTFTYTYDTAGIYIPTLRIEDTLGCGVTYIGDTIRVDTLEIDFMASDTFSCGGDSITFTPFIVSSFPLDSIEWIFYGAQGSVVTTLNPTINYPTSGEYDVEMKIYSGHCFYSIRKNNYIKIAPVPDVLYQVATNPRCEDELVIFNNITQINGSNITQWEWRFGDNTTFNQAQPSAHNYPAAGSYNVVLTAMTDLGCVDSMVQTVHVLPAPTAAAMNSGDTLCIGDTITLNGFGNGTFEWSPAASLDCPTCQNPVASPSAATQYRLIVTSSGGCQDTAFTQVNVRPFERPTLNLTADTTLCQGDFLQLLAQTNADITQIQWSTADAGLSCYSGCSNPIATPQVTTTYSVLVDGQDVCDASDSVTITVIDPNSNILGNDVAICSGDSTQLQIAFGTNAVWSPTDGLTCANCPNPVASPNQTTNYTVTAQVGSCIIQDTIQVEIVDLSQFSAGTDNSICPGDTIVLQGTSPVNGTYQWQPSASLDNSTILTPIASPDSTTNYIVTINYGNCNASDTVTIEVNNKTELTVIEAIEICEGEEVLIDVFGNADQIVWSPMDGILQENPVIVSPTQTTIYTVIGTRNNCEADTALVTVTVYPNPALEVFSFISRYQNETQPTLLTVIEPSTDYAYNWSPNIDISCEQCPEPFTTTDTTRMYYVDAVSDFGCFTSDSILVTVIDSSRLDCGDDLVLMPNTFTPNGDRHNDKFYVRGNGVQAITTFRVFNRWGDMVFETDDITEGWDGMYQNEQVIPDVYVYYVEAICPLTNETKIFKGDISVLY